MTLVAALGTIGTAASLGALSGTAATVAGGLLAGSALYGVSKGVEEMTAPEPETPGPQGPSLAPGLSPAMNPAEVNAPSSSAPLSGLASIGSSAPQQRAATGGIIMAKGGEVPLSDGAFIIPADVVSALGNGSTKAGAEYLDRLMAEAHKVSTKRHGLGTLKNEDA